jgi:hypothetical protein
MEFYFKGTYIKKSLELNVGIWLVSSITLAQ